MIAERIRVLGVKTPGSYADYEKLTSIPAVKGAPKAMEMVVLLVAGQEATARRRANCCPWPTRPTTSRLWIC